MMCRDGSGSARPAPEPAVRPPFLERAFNTKRKILDARRFPQKSAIFRPAACTFFVGLRIVSQILHFGPGAARSAFPSCRNWTDRSVQ